MLNFSQLRNLKTVTISFIIGTIVLYFSRSSENSSDESESSRHSNHKFPGKFNLIEEAVSFNGALQRPSKSCLLEVMNNERLQQDHPCVINNIRKHFLNSPSNEPLNLDYPEVKDPSDGQSEGVLHLLKNKANGFFIECGALDGENLSNTIYMERYLNWTGILIEADQNVFQDLMSKKRKVWALPVCLSDDPYPQVVTFRASYALGGVVNEKIPARNLSGRTGGYGRNIEVQCFPLYSILLAVGRTEIDYFSLDVEGHELFVLKTIPFHKINIKILSVEIFRTSDELLAVYDEIIDYMKLQGYDFLHLRKMDNDVIFVKRDYVNEFLVQR